MNTYFVSNTIKCFYENKELSPFLPLGLQGKPETHEKQQDSVNSNLKTHSKQKNVTSTLTFKGELHHFFTWRSVY